MARTGLSARTLCALSASIACVTHESGRDSFTMLEPDGSCGRALEICQKRAVLIRLRRKGQLLSAVIRITSSAMFRTRIAAGWVAMALVCGCFPCCQKTGAAVSSATPPKEGIALAQPLSGEALARVHCARCHVFPAPDLLDKKTWIEQTLLRMSIRLGLAPEEIERHPESKL